MLKKWKNIKDTSLHSIKSILEELDHLKKGNDTINFEAREFIRMIDELSNNQMLNNWIPLNGKTKGKFKILVNQKTKNNVLMMILMIIRFWIQP